MESEKHNERYRVVCGKWGEFKWARPKDFDTFFLKNWDRKRLVELIWNEEYQTVHVYDKLNSSAAIILKEGDLIHKDYLK